MSAIEWTDADKAMCAQVAAEVIGKVMGAHIDSCPHGRQQALDKRFLVGITLGAGLLSGSGAVLVLRHLIGG
jgi:hypothetical protein